MMEGMRRTLVSLIAVSAVLAACADQPQPEPLNPRDAVLDAIEAVYHAGTLHQEFEMAMSASGQDISFSGEADVDRSNQEIDMTMDLGLLGDEMQVVMSDGILYVRSPMFQGAPTEWVSMDPSKLSPEDAAQFGNFGMGTTDPSAYAGLFAGVFDVKDAGEQEIDGVTTTHYTGTIDLTRALENFSEVVGERADEASRKQLETAIDQFETLGVEDRIEFHLWVDDEGLPRRQRITMDFGQLMDGVDDASMAMTVDYSAFGEPVDVRVPPASEVTDVTQAMGKMGGA
jgi:hypothetical protein